MVPAWIVDAQWKDLTPPAEVRELGNSRSAENLLAASAALNVTKAKRYRPIPGGVTWCNIFLADVLAILKAHIPHWFEIPTGAKHRAAGKRVELRANDIVQGLREGWFQGWRRLQDGLSAANYAALGLPSVAVWENKKGGPGHVVLVVPTPKGKAGVYVTGAGRNCIEQCPIEQAFGSYLKEVEFYGHD